METRKGWDMPKYTRTGLKISLMRWWPQILLMCPEEAWKEIQQWVSTVTCKHGLDLEFSQWCGGFYLNWWNEYKEALADFDVPWNIKATVSVMDWSHQRSTLLKQCGFILFLKIMSFKNPRELFLKISLRNYKKV